MNIIIRKVEQEEYPILTDIWERSVRATHNFLLEKDLQEIKENLPTLYFPNADIHVIIYLGNIVGFIGLSNDTIEMLFVDAGFMGKGIGSELLRFAFDQGIRKVDVNEQNESALRFYQNKGFRITGRDETDADCRDYPILHLSL